MTTASRITLETNDRVTIVGDWVRPAGATRAALLLHMMPSTRGSWLPLSEALNAAGIATLAIDLRGHGESTEQRTGQKGDLITQLDYKNFTDAQHQSSRLDVDAAINYIKTFGFREDHIVVAGASIGANMALNAIDRYSLMPRAVALSPGLNYHGVTTEMAAAAITAPQQAWLVAAEGDSTSAEAVHALQKLSPQLLQVTVYPGDAHGTKLFQSEPELIKKIVEYLATK